jgi:hypothetical protein
VEGNLRHGDEIKNCPDGEIAPLKILTGNIFATHLMSLWHGETGRGLTL